MRVQLPVLGAAAAALAVTIAVQHDGAFDEAADVVAASSRTTPAVDGGSAAASRASAPPASAAPPPASAAARAVSAAAPAPAAVDGSPPAPASYEPPPRRLRALAGDPFAVPAAPVVRLAPPPPPPAAPPPAPPTVPFVLIGRVLQGDDALAIVRQQDRVLTLRAGQTAAGFTVDAVGEAGLVLRHADTDTVLTLRWPAPGAAPAGAG